MTLIRAVFSSSFWLAMAWSSLSMDDLRLATFTPGSPQILSTPASQLGGLPTGWRVRGEGTLRMENARVFAANMAKRQSLCTQLFC